MNAASLTQIYNCLGDETRLRMVALLLEGPLCVCHFQDILGIAQVKTSRHLAYLREHGLVEVTKNANWRIYQLPKKPNVLLASTLSSLRGSVEKISQLKQDRRARKRIEEDITASTLCCS